MDAIQVITALSVVGIMGYVGAEVVKDKVPDFSLKKLWVGIVTGSFAGAIVLFGLFSIFTLVTSNNSQHSKTICLSEPVVNEDRFGQSSADCEHKQQIIVPLGTYLIDEGKSFVALGLAFGTWVMPMFVLTRHYKLRR